MSQKYPLSAFLTGKIDQKAHSRWLSRRSIAHVKRDKKRGNTTALNEAYKKAIHLAAVDSAGLDEHTEETLDWHLVSTYDNDKSKTHRRKYKSLFALLPTVDHIDDGLGEPSFKICGWRTNDAKCDLSSRPGGISPPGASRTVRDPLESHGSRCSAVAMTQCPMSKERWVGPA